MKNETSRVPPPKLVWGCELSTDYPTPPNKFEGGTRWRSIQIWVVGEVHGSSSPGRFGAGPTPPPEPTAVAMALEEPASSSGYHIAYDRGPQIGENRWNAAMADGTINMSDDILGVAFQSGHKCFETPTPTPTATPTP